jgi:radical SAM superfamily enzyme YgiQ (UPF0313 family)
MSKSIYMINPAADFPTYYGAEAFERWGFGPVMSIADLATTTVAALAPNDFTVDLCENYISAIDYETPADFVAITGKVGQWRTARAIAREFRRRGKVVIMGGPFASLTPQVVRPHCDILVRGEIEEIAADLFSDLRADHWKEEYVGTQPDLKLSPTPRWDLYPHDRTILGTVQTSRGCPYECEFCDVIQYLGRKQRHKAPAQVLAELDQLYRYGYRNVLLSDDNFTVFRHRAKELLAALRDWNNRQERGRVKFLTQVSIDAADDDEMLRLCVEAGLTMVFIGIETPNLDSHREMKKRQNLRGNLLDKVNHVISYGIEINGGMIVGFDSDGLDIFERQLDFAMSTGIPIYTLGALNAPAATPLHDRMKRDGRLVDEAYVIGSPFVTNIIPKRMTTEELSRGIQWLGNQLYAPAAFGERVMRFIDQHPRVANTPWARPRPVDLKLLKVARQIPQLGLEEERMWSRVTKAIADKPETANAVMSILFRYMQIRFIYEHGDFWDPGLISSASPDPVRAPAQTLVEMSNWYA